MSTDVAQTTPQPLNPQLRSILFVSTSTDIGGAEKVLYELATHARQRGIRVAVCSLKPKGPYSEALETMEIPVQSLNMSEAVGWKGALSFLLCLPGLARIIKKNKPQIVVSLLFRANLLSRLASKLCRVPANISSIHIIENDRPYYYLLDRWTAFMVTQYVAVSEKVKEATCRRSAIRPTRIKVIYNGVELKQEAQDPPDHCGDSEHSIIAARLGIFPGDQICGTVARLRPQKGIDYLLKAVPLLKSRFLGLKLLIVGDGPERATLELQAQKLDIQDRVIFAGLAASPFPYLRLMQVFVLPSLYEGLPMAILEAMAMGIPVVATNVGGVGEILEDQSTGLLVPPKNSEAIATAISLLLAQPSKAAQVAEAAKQTVRTRFNRAIMLREYDQVYDDLFAP